MTREIREEEREVHKARGRREMLLSLEDYREWITK